MYVADFSPCPVPSAGSSRIHNAAQRHLICNLSCTANANATCFPTYYEYRYHYCYYRRCVFIIALLVFIISQLGEIICPLSLFFISQRAPLRLRLPGIMADSLFFSRNNRHRYHSRTTPILRIASVHIASSRRFNREMWKRLSVLEALTTI